MTGGPRSTETWKVCVERATGYFCQPQKGWKAKLEPMGLESQQTELGDYDEEADAMGVVSVCGLR